MVPMVKPVEKVSTIGIRNQITLPKDIRDAVKITAKTEVYIKNQEDQESLIISLEKPTEGVYNSVKISEKGQLVIPKNYRESKGIKGGTNLLFRVSSGTDIIVQILPPERKESTRDQRWNLLIDIFKALNGFSTMNTLQINDGSLVVGFDKDIKVDSKLTENIERIENILGTRLMVEKVQDSRLKLTPLGIRGEI
ncbi:MAG: AbrB/MazE/SpoVT family DNA-binding domain-containing protein [Candidatus Odinarchaeota archaeon]